MIAADMPLGLVVPDGTTDFEAVAQGDPGAPLGRELQIAELLRFIKHRRITGTVWLTADVHYTSAQHYAPERAAFKDFAPFWEFVSGPLAAGGFPANALDDTFGPDRVFVRAPDRANVSPMESPQYFGEVEIDGDSAELTVRLRAEGEPCCSPRCSGRAASGSEPRLPWGPLSVVGPTLFFMTRSVQALAYARPSSLESSQVGPSLGLETSGASPRAERRRTLGSSRASSPIRG